MNERNYPHIVELALPAGGFGSALDTFDAFHRERGLENRRGRRQRRDEQEFVRWCFGDRSDAEAFAKRFGGVVISP